MKLSSSPLLILLLVSVAPAQELTQRSSGPVDSLPAFATPEQTVPPNSGCNLLNDAGAEARPGGFLTGNHSFPNFIGFMSDPLQSIDPRALTDIYPIFGSSWVSTSHILPEGDLQLYGAGLTVALSERLALGLNQGGYAVSSFAGKPHDGWLNLGGFFQYTFVADVPNQFLMTGGLRWVAPSGRILGLSRTWPSHTGSLPDSRQGTWRVSRTGDFRLPVSVSLWRLLNQLFYTNVHFDRRCFGWLYPLLEFNYSYHSTSVDLADTTPSGFFNFGDFEATGNILEMAAGFNAVVVPERFEIGAAYTTTLATQRRFPEKTDLS